MAGQIRTHMGAVEWALLITLSVLWGGSFFFIEVIVQFFVGHGAEPPVLTIVALRVALAAAALWAVVAVTIGRAPASARLWAAFATMGLINNAVPFTLITWGQGSGDGALASGVAAILNATTPLFTVVLAGAALRDERLTGLRALGVAIGFAGVVVMIGPGALLAAGPGAGSPWDATLAKLAILGAAMSYAFAGVFGRRFAALGAPPIVAAAGQTTASSAILIPLALAAEGGVVFAPGFPVPGAGPWAALAALALISTAVGYLIYFRILAAAGATNIALVTFLVPVWATVLGAAFLAERLAPAHWAGMALIGLGLSAIDGRIWTARPRTG